MRPVIALSFIALASGAAPPLVGVVVPQAVADVHGAKCLDGTPPAYAIHHGDPKTWIVFVEGVSEGLASLTAHGEDDNSTVSVHAGATGGVPSPLHAAAIRVAAVRYGRRLYDTGGGC